MLIFFFGSNLIGAVGNYQLETVVAPNVYVKGDIDLLNVVIENLLHNAWKFTDEIKIASIEWGSTLKDGNSVYSVKDNGVGFDQQRADEIFEPFKKLHDKADYPGIGIGLNLAYRIITRHGGEIWAEREPGKGACFYFSLQ
jgi:signal transduction histidine kinase